MQFKNLTPFDALAYSGIDTQDREYHVVAMAVGYRLVCIDNPQTPNHWRADLIEDEPVPLCLADEHWGEPAHSSLARESDLVPYKPKCDVLVRGHAYAPDGQPAKHWRVQIKLTVSHRELPPPPSRPHPLNPYMDLTPNQQREWQTAQARHRAELARVSALPPREVLHKILDIHGPSHFERWSLLGWQRSATQAASSVPLRWEHSFGGSSLVLPHQPDAQAKDPVKPLLNEVCFSNPVGAGWLHKGWEHALAKAKQPLPAQLPAPQIVALNERLPSSPLEHRHPTGEQDARAMRTIASGYARQPQGLGPLCKAWAPRLALAGTYDEAWLEQRHPLLPKDFDFAYWNGAPQDQQIDFPDLTKGYTLYTQGLTPGSGYMRVDIPPHRAVTLADLGGLHLPFAMQVDTMLLDTDDMTLTLVWRCALLKTTAPQTLEARFITDPKAPWVPYHPIDADEQIPQGAPA